MRTRLTELFGIEHPVVLGGMGSATNADLVVAVSEAGGLGILGASGFSPQELREQIEQIRSRTSKPFGINLLIPFTTEAQLDAALDARVPVLSTAWGDPPLHVRRANEAGIPLLHMVQTAAQAAQAARWGAAAIVAQGHEGGGHVGEVGTLPLVPATGARDGSADPPRRDQTPPASGPMRSPARPAAARAR